MSDVAGSPEIIDPVEERLREALEMGDAMLRSAAPVLRHLLASDNSALFEDAVLARVRGMVGDVARQLLEPLGTGEGMERVHAALSGALLGDSAFLTHVHALALEGRLAELLQTRLSIDPVLSPLLQALIGSDDRTTADLAMKFLAAQARFGLAQRRMCLPLAELPGDLLHAALLRARELAGAPSQLDSRAASVRAEYDEGRSRLGLLSRLVSGMGAGVLAALSLPHAGAALFLSALAMASRQDREHATLATSEAGHARLALSLCSAGLKPAAIEEQLLVIDADATLPVGLDRLEPDRAAALLAAGR